MTPPSGVADDAAKALSALEGWLRSVSVASSPHAGASTQAPTTCEFCPICQLIAVARHARPDVMEHLAEAFGAALLAFRALTEQQHTDDSPAQVEEPAEQAVTAVQHITIT